jgi:hypothetical protein
MNIEWNEQGYWIDQQDALLVILIIGLGAVRINTWTPIGAIRYECFIHGHILSALFLKAEEISVENRGEARVYIITSFVPYEKATETHLDQWNVIKKKNGTYSAAYGVA